MNMNIVAQRNCQTLWTTTNHYDDVIMDCIASQITSLPVVCSIVYSGVNQRKPQSSASLAFVREIHREPVNFPHKWPVTRKMFPFDDVIMFRAHLKESRFEELFKLSIQSYVSTMMKSNSFLQTEMEMTFSIFSPWISVVCWNMVGKLLNFISRMETKFSIIIFTEIGTSIVLNLFPTYTFHYVRPQNNNYRCVGICTHNWW